MPVAPGDNAISDGAAGSPVVSSLLSIAKSTRAYIALLLAEIELHPGQDQLLDQLEPGRRISVSELAERLAVRPSTVSKMLDRLLERGLVERASNDSDARRTMVRLTENGAETRKAIHAIWARLERELTSNLSKTDLAALDRTLTTTCELLSRKLRRLR